MAVVDYDSGGVAHRYASGRSLDGDVLDEWGTAVRRFTPTVPAEPYRVLDVGAGTGIFARAWPSWISCEVLALEPSAAMRAQMVACGLPHRVRVIAGRAEALPLRAGSVDVAWLSAVVHHIIDIGGCAHELRRVVIDRGVVLIRGFLVDSTAPPGLRFLPGWERALSVFPTEAELDAALSAWGFRLLDRLEVRDRGPANVGEAAERVRHLRRADSLLAPLTDDEIAAGLAAMQARDPREPLEPASLTLLAFGAKESPR